MPIGLNHRFHSGNVAVVVRPPDIDEMVETAAELFRDVADVCREIGWLAVRAVDHAVLVVAKVRRAEPCRSVPLVDVARLAQLGDCSLDPALPME